MGPMMGWPALKPLLKRAWDRRDTVDHGERLDFVGALGLMASKTGVHELALEIWRYGRTLPGGEPFGPNLAVELSNLGRHAEALEAAETMSMDTPRSWTILGNTRRSAGQYKLAMEAYRIALDKDDRFLLPIGNAIAAAREGLMADEVEPFIERLRAEWQSSFTAISILGQALLLQGKLSSAAECFQRALWEGDAIRTPEAIWAEGRDAEDLSLLGESDLGNHYAAAKCFLELGRLDLLTALVASVRGWPKWMNGDWMILEAEVYLSANDLDRASAVVNGMRDQPPPRIVAAKIAIESGDFQEADRLIALGLADEEAQGFNYPEGRPDAMFRVLAAERAFRNGEPERSEELARDAIRRDPACARARRVLVSALEGRAAEAERQELLADGLRRSPGHPALVAALVESLVAEGDSEEASAVFEKHRPLLDERGATVVAHRLGELLAVDRLSRLSDKSDATLSANSPWPWLEQFQSPLRDWMRGAHLALSRGEELAAAYGLYISKVAEYLLVSKIMVPFRASLPDAHLLSSDRHRDAARFMSGGTPPSIGGIARLLDAASRSYRSSDDELTDRFRDAVSSGKFGDSRLLRSRELVDQIMELGMVRNSTAHLGDHDMAALRTATRCVVSEGRPGMLLLALGLC
jgi:tetratricopeptide (TPR) repeat protein